MRISSCFGAIVNWVSPPVVRFNIVTLMLCLCGWISPSIAQEISLQETPLQETLQEECISFNVGPLDIADKKTSRVDTSSFEPLEGKTIRHIRFQQMTIFDASNPDENNRIYMLLNKLHVKTRTNVVASQLLFQVGDKISYKRLEETARNLRAQKYLTNAYVLPEKVCGDAVDVVVITQDAWAIEPQFSFSRKSNDNQTGFAISDGNVFGSGNSFRVGYTENALRKSVFYELSNPYFLNKKIALRVMHEDTSDGRNNFLSIARPFYSLDSAWASGFKISDLSQVEEIRSRDVLINSFLHKAVNNEVFYGRATDINSAFTQRWLLGFTHEEDTFVSNLETLQPIPLQDKAVYPWVEYQYLRNKYGVYKNLNQIQRPEDVVIGQTLSARLGYAGTSFGNQDDVVLYKINYANVIDVSDIHLFEFELELDGRQHLNLDGLDPTIFTASAAYHYLIDEKNRWYARMEIGAGENLPQYKELTVGDITGLRGYPTDFLRGDRRYVFTLERRYFSDVHIFNLMRLGGVAFFDTGKAWGLPNESRAQVLSNIGLGLRLSSSKIRIGNVVHIDVAMPTTAKEGLSKYQLTIGAYKKF